MTVSHRRRAGRRVRPAGEMAVVTRGLTKRYGDRVAVAGPGPQRAPRPGLRLPGTQRLRQDHDAADAGGTHPAQRGRDRGPRATLVVARPAADVPDRRHDRDARVLPLPVGTRQPAGLCRDRGTDPHQPGGRGPRSGRADRPGLGQGAHLLPGHAPAAGYRGGARVRPGPAAARRAGQRSRSGRHRGHARAAALPHRPRQDRARVQPHPARGPAAGGHRGHHRPRPTGPRRPHGGAAGGWRAGPDAGATR